MSEKSPSSPLPRPLPPDQIIDLEEVTAEPAPEAGVEPEGEIESGVAAETEDSEAFEALPEDDDGGHPPMVAALLAAAIFLTRLPIPFGGQVGPNLFGRAMGWYPLIGALLGVGAGLAFGLAGGLGLPPLLAAVLTVGLLIAVTGALHEDGLADSVDALGGADRERRLAIMRDSRIGAFGTLALIVSVAVRVAAVAALPGTWIAVKVLAVAGAVSRAAMVAVAHWLPPARRDGLSATLGRPANGATLLALVLALGVALLLLRLKMFLVLLVATVVTVLVMRLARIKLGGQTGDVLGATQQAVELALLVLLVALR